MNKDLRKKISEKLKEKITKSEKRSEVRLPGGFIFSEDSNILTMRFSSERNMRLGGTYCNM